MQLPHNLGVTKDHSTLACDALSRKQGLCGDKGEERG